jgi:hypothetical protein
MAAGCEEGFVDAGLLANQHAKFPIVERPSACGRERREDAGIVVPQILRVVLLAQERESAGLEHFLIGAQVEWFRVDEDAVEVEDKGGNH